MSAATLGSIGLLALLNGCTNQPQAQGQAALPDDLVAQIYKSPTCGCCGQYVGYLEQHGVSVETIEVEQMDHIKQDLNIPQSMWSCHTAKIGDYYVEGHVPVESLARLLNELPDVDGIALPGMPAGAPGMGGDKQEPFVIYSIKDGSSKEYMSV